MTIASVHMKAFEYYTPQLFPNGNIIPQVN